MGSKDEVRVHVPDSVDPPSKLMVVDNISYDNDTSNPKDNDTSEDIVVRQNPVWTNIKTAFKRNLIPGLCLQGFAVLLLVLYYSDDSIKSVFDSVGALKERSGFGFSIVSTVIFGGLIPFALIWNRNRKVDIRYTQPLFVARHLSFFVIYWVFVGIEVDVLYQFQSWMFGSTPDIGTTIKKMLFDQFVWTPFWPVVRSIIPYRWESLDFPGLDVMKKEITWPMLKQAYPTTLFPMWMVWLPCVSIVYSLPASLQIPIFELVLLFWVLILDLISKKEPPPPNAAIQDSTAKANSGSDIQLEAPYRIENAEDI